MANAIFFSDYCHATIAAAASASQGTLLVTTPDEDFPTLATPGDYFYLTIVDSPSYDINLQPPAQREIVKVTAYTPSGSNYLLTVTRGITTTAQIWAVGSV